MTRAELVERRAVYVKAEADVLSYGQSYEINGKRFTRPPIEEIRAAIKQIDQQIDEIDYGGSVVRAGFGVPS